MSVEKTYSVVAEMADRSTKTFSVKGNSPGEVFQQVKQMPDVRRVGKVTDSAANDRPPVHQMKTPGDPDPGHRDKWIGHVISGPRVISHVRPSGGEQPFKHLQAPPERPKPPQPQPQPTFVTPIPEQEPRQEEKAGEVSEVSYRIIKSRRREGQPYLLQRGSMNERGGKHIFSVQWEKDFPSREHAEKHQAWVLQTELEMVALND